MSEESEAEQYDMEADEAMRSDRRSGSQRREAFRVAMNLPVYVDEPMELYCELVDISVLGLRLDRELPCTPGVAIGFRLEVPTYGATPKPDEHELYAEVVRVERGFTGLRFLRMDTDQTKTVREIVHGHQRRLLLAERPAALDRRKSWLQR